MTLITTLLTPTHVVQVSDRRVTWTEDGKIVRKDDMRNKAVLYCSRIAIQYTGMATVGSADTRYTGTDVWVASQIAECITISRFFDEIPDRLATVVAEHSEMQRRTLTLVASGWAFFDDRVIAFRRIITNRRGDNRQLLRPDGTLFEHHHFELPPSSIAVDTAGVGMSSDRRHALMRAISKVGKHGASINAVVRLIVEAMREVAKFDERVGRGLMITVLPLSAVRPDEGEHLILYGSTGDATPTFAYAPADSAETIAYGPIEVCGGGVMTDFQMRAVTDEDR